jgi:hypothetical protein
LKEECALVRFNSRVCREMGELSITAGYRKSLTDKRPVPGYTDKLIY